MSRVQRSPWNDRAGGGFENLRTNTAVSGGGGTPTSNLTIRDDKGNSFADIIDLELFNSLATSTGPGVAQWRVDDVSLLAPGIVNLSDQEMGQNDKIFNKFVLVNSSGWADSGIDSFPNREAFGVYSYRDGFDPFVRFSSLDAQLQVGHRDDAASGFGQVGQLNAPVWVGYNYNRFQGLFGSNVNVTSIFGARTGVKSAGSTMWYVENQDGLEWEATIVSPTVTGGGGGGDIRTCFAIRNGTEASHEPGTVRLMWDIGGPAFPSVLRWGATNPPGSLYDYRYGVQDFAGVEWEGQSTNFLQPGSKFVGGILVLEGSSSAYSFTGAAYSIPSDSTFFDTGGGITFVEAGTYLVWITCQGTLFVSGDGGNIDTKLVGNISGDMTTPVGLARARLNSPCTEGFEFASHTYAVQITVAATETVDVYARRVPDSVFTAFGTQTVQVVEGIVWRIG